MKEYLGIILLKIYIYKYTEWKIHRREVFYNVSWKNLSNDIIDYFILFKCFLIFLQWACDTFITKRNTYILKNE